MRAQFRSRIRLVLAFLILAALGTSDACTSSRLRTGRLFAKADRQFSSGGSGLFDRGAIYFTRKDGTLISAATLATGFLVAINPQVLGDPEATQSAIPSAGSLFDNPRDAFIAAAARSRGCI